MPTHLTLRAAQRVSAMSTRIELITLLLFASGAGMLFFARTTMSIPGVTLSVLAILLAKAARLWCQRRRSVLGSPICLYDGDDGSRDSTKDRHLDGAK